MNELNVETRSHYHTLWYSLGFCIPKCSAISYSRACRPLLSIMWSKRALALLAALEVCVIFGCCSNLRIKVFYDDTVQSLPGENKTIVKQVYSVHSMISNIFNNIFLSVENVSLWFQHMSKAIKFWQDALQVVKPRRSPILMSHNCQYWPHLSPPNSTTKYCAGSCPTNKKCGDISVPKEHLGDCYSCSSKYTSNLKNSCKKD